ncbi:MAG: ABC transporter ATP-binding protein, partial [Leadbetterella sp.]|nr:ABC transporter ATP-binding protein [Leadbetterella sp.]
LDAKRKRLEQESKEEASRSKTLERELEWMRQTPEGRRKKSKARIAAYDQLLADAENESVRNAQIVIPAPPRLANQVVIAENISKGFDDRLLIDGLSFKLPPGGIVGVIGPNGAGKTTLISMLCGLIRPSSGDFTINGWSYRSEGEKIRKNMGVVPQEYALYPSLTARENLVYFGSMYGLSGKELEVKIEEHLGHLGLLKYAGKKIETYSGGMKRRVNLIAGILHSPMVLFLDEPTVGVDIQSKNVIIDFLKAYNRGGTTLIYTSHHLSEAQEFCTRVAIMDHGRVLTEGTPEELIRNAAGTRSLEDVFLSLVGKELRDYA